MITLAVNTASSKTGIALIRDNSLLGETEWISENNEAEKLMPAIDNLLIKLGISYKDLTDLLVVKGPGSFTGLRVGITVINSLSYLLNIPIHTLNTFELCWLFQKRSLHKAETAATEDISQTSFAATPKLEKLALLIFAGKGGVYLSLLSNPSTGELINLPDLNTTLKKLDIKKTFGDISTEQKDTLDIPFIENKESFGTLILKTDITNLPTEKIVTPLYIKTPGITRTNKSLFN